MRLLTVTHFYEGHGGGIERVAGQLNREFTAIGHRASWAASDRDSEPAIDTAVAVPLRCWNPIERLSGLPMPIPGWSALRRLGQAAASSDAVIVHDALYLSSIAAMWAAKRAGKPVLLIQHIADIPFSNLLLRAASRLANAIVTGPMLRAADRVVFISPAVRETFAKVHIAPPPMVLYNGVDTAVFRPPSREERIVERGALGVAETDRLMLFVGRFVEKKGLAVLARLARGRPDLRFVLAGRGPIDPDGWGLGNVTVLRDRAGPSLAALYGAADLLLLPSVGEGYPLVIQEAIACGLSIVCGAATARADLVAARWMTGIDVDLARPDAAAVCIAATVDALLERSFAREEMAAYALAAYSWPRMAKRILAELASAEKTPLIDLIDLSGNVR